MAWAKLERGALVGRESTASANTLARAFIYIVRCCTRLRRPTPRPANPHADAGLEYCVEQGLETWRLYLLASPVRG